MTLHTARGYASGMSTFTAEEAAIHRSKGFELEAITVPVTTLADICAKTPKGKRFDFLSIDVEGHEREVLEGADFRAFRPRVVVIEATRPNTTEPTHEGWEHLILRHEYVFAVFDGLNRYYVRAEDALLVPKVALAPNVFDDFAPYVYQRQIDALNAELLTFRAANSVLRVISPVAQGVRKISDWIGTVAADRCASVSCLSCSPFGARPRPHRSKVAPSANGQGTKPEERKGRGFHRWVTPPDLGTTSSRNCFHP